MIVVHCPHCRRFLAEIEEGAKARVRCRDCRKTISIDTDEIVIQNARVGT